MQEFEITGVSQTLNAILKLTIENNIAIKAANTFMLENINNGMRYDENLSDFSDLAQECRSKCLEDLFLKYGDLNLKDILGDK